MKVNTERLAALLRQQPADQAMVISELFVLGCLLRLQGHRNEGTRACRTALKALNVTGTASYRDALIDALPGNEAAFASNLQPGTCLNRLVRAQAASAQDPQSGACEATQDDACCTRESP